MFFKEVGELMVNWCACVNRKAGLQGKGELEEAQVDMVVDFVNELRDARQYFSIKKNLFNFREMYVFYSHREHRPPSQRGDPGGGLQELQRGEAAKVRP